MSDHSLIEREITGMYRDCKKWIKGKEKIDKIQNGEWDFCIVHDIHSERIHTIYSLYDDEPREGAICCSSLGNIK